MTTIPMQERVQAGIDFLDEHGPVDWPHHATFINMGSMQSCVLARVAQHLEGDDYITYGRALDLFGLSYQDATRLGFDWDEGETFEDLNKVWRKMLAELRGEEV